MTSKVERQTKHSTSTDKNAIVNYWDLNTAGGVGTAQHSDISLAFLPQKAPSQTLVFKKQKTLALFQEQGF